MNRFPPLTRPSAALAALLLSLGLIGAQPLSAAPTTPTVPAAQAVKVQKLVVATRTDGDVRLVLTVKGKGVKKVRVTVGDAKYRLRPTKSKKQWRTQLGTWQSGWQEGAAATELQEAVGKKVEVSLTTDKGTIERAVAVKAAAGGAAPPAPVAPTPVTPEPDPSTPAPDPGGGSPDFPAPGTDQTGPAAWEAIRPYFENSRFTNCPTGWGSGACASEERYSHMANGQQYYCRITNVSGADINSVGTIIGILGAEQKADGSWAVTYALDSYGSITHYTWRVAADGSVTGEYWGPGVNPTTTAGEQISGLVWARGGLTCDQYTP